ncbi:kinase-like protein [Gigaspora margarita]|uniref:Kinase-like protein n=1 Tax=Gigaspora margarita TaxID=4874 RepID=A0A8H4AU75_GIGMA|nr:kinase-like protein [Gigaspora margarita]
MSNVSNANDAVVLFLNVMKVLVRDVNQIYENAECNKELCSIMVDQVVDGESAIRKILGKNNSEYYFQEYFLRFKRFENVLTNIKDFTNKVSKLEGFRKFFSTAEVQINRKKLIEDFDTSMEGLKFIMTDVNKSQNEKIDESLRDAEETLRALGNELDLVVQSVNIAKHSSNILPIINQNELSEPEIQDSRGSKHFPIVKKFYKDSEVACRPTKKSRYLNEELVILGKLCQLFGNLPNILQFYGLSHVDNYDVMVFEWAEYGSLKELYTMYHIAWTRKIQIIRDICRGFVYLRSLKIFHHDVRCNNVFILHNMEPKLGNFGCGRPTDADTRNLSDLATDIVHWMAPEQIDKYKNQKYQEKKYSFNSEIFSLGMLIWELCYEKIPYDGWDFKRIIDHVQSGKRENLSYGNFDNPIVKEILIELIKIICEAWNHTPQERMSIINLHQKLEKLTETYPIYPDEISLNKKISNIDKLNTARSINPASLRFEHIPKNSSYSSYIPLEVGIKLHQSKDHVNAWKCFEENANLCNLKAKYWQGYYLYHEYGVVKQDIEKAKQLYKEAADSDHPDAQYRYAALLLMDLKKDNENARKERCAEILHYFKLAADNNHLDAVYCMGDIYAKGKLQVQQNKKFGLEYLRLAAKHNHKKAINLLKELETSTQPEPMDIE